MRVLTVQQHSLTRGRYDVSGPLREQACTATSPCWGCVPDDLDEDAAMGTSHCGRHSELLPRALIELLPRPRLWTSEMRMLHALATNRNLSATERSLANFSALGHEKRSRQWPAAPPRYPWPVFASWEAMLASPWLDCSRARSPTHDRRHTRASPLRDVPFALPRDSDLQTSAPSMARHSGAMAARRSRSRLMCAVR